MKIGITGATGFIGSHLGPALDNQGHQTISVSRNDLTRGPAWLGKMLDGCDGVVNLAGEPINKRWTEAYKRKILNSRVQTTSRLVTSLSGMRTPPSVFLSASAIGAYDSEGNYDDNDPPNATDFLGRVSREWEEAAMAAAESGIRTAVVRFALVLGKDGGLMKQILPIFRLGLGGPIGTGKQHFSWVHIDDAVNACLHILQHPKLSGPFNISAPHPTDNRGFTKTLGSVLGRPAILPVHPTMLRLAFGEGADVMVSGQSVISKRLPESGFSFAYPQLKDALTAVVNASNKSCPFN